MLGVKVAWNSSDQMASNSNLRYRFLQYLKYAKMRTLFLAVSFRTETTNSDLI